MFLVISLLSKFNEVHYEAHEFQLEVSVTVNSYSSNTASWSFVMEVLCDRTVIVK